MRIHADLTTDGTGIALDVDHPHNLQILDAAFVKSTAVALTPAEAAELRDELTRILDEIAFKALSSVLTSPKPGDRVEWKDGEVWTVERVDVAGDKIERVWYRMTYPGGAQSEDADFMEFQIWADPMDEGGGSPFVCVPASDAPPPAP